MASRDQKIVSKEMSRERLDENAGLIFCKRFNLRWILNELA
jgi:hypothetical protein